MVRRHSGLIAVAVAAGCSGPAGSRSDTTAATSHRPPAQDVAPDGSVGEPAGTARAQLVEGEKGIQPDDDTIRAISNDGHDRLDSTAKLCIDKLGAVTSVDTLISTGYPVYDSKLVSTMRTWRFTPFRVDGKPVAVCSTYTFSYKAPRRPPAPPPSTAPPPPPDD